MGSNQDAAHSASAFSGSVASVVFVDPSADADPTRSNLSKRVLAWVRRASREDLHRHCSAMDSILLKHLSGKDFLQIAIEIERRAPEVIENMPRLKADQVHLRKAEQLAAIFQPAALERLVKALGEEGNR
jgi:hypothetical protein